MNRQTSLNHAMAILVAILILTAAAPSSFAQPLPGAIFTTDSICSGVNLNIYDSKESVYLNGGPSHPGAAGLPDGDYFVKVTEPSGTLLGTSVGSGNDTPIQVSNGEFDRCYQLWAILIKASDGAQGYDSTSNPGGEYKVWVSQTSSFANSSSKTDNFKVKEGSPPETATLKVLKFYDANANGQRDEGEALLDGWQILIENSVDLVRYTPVTVLLDPGAYTVTESMPVETNWQATTPNPVSLTLAAGETATVEFGNLCLGEGGGHTKGFWQSPNGEALFDDDDLALMDSLNLRNADGSNFDPTSYDEFKAWLKGANAKNMAYMLSAQLAAMELNVSHDFVDGGALIYAPGTKSANEAGFATVDAVMDEANDELGLHGYTPAGNPYRSYQEALKDALDNANNNQTFVQPEACPFTFEASP